MRKRVLIAGVAFAAAVCPAIHSLAAEAVTPLAVDAAKSPKAAQAPGADLRVPPAVNRGRAWHIYKTEWSAADEAGFSAFVRAIGESSCLTLDDCLSGPQNPYRDTDPAHHWNGDCADMAYFLRGYYAWKNGLPFAYERAVRTVAGKGEDARYSSEGNIILSRREALTPASGKPVDAPSYLTRMMGEVSTAMFRVHPTKLRNASYNDFYPIEIDRAYVRAGAIAYDIYGHAGIIYDVLDDGRVQIVASHPDHSVSRSLYGANFLRAKPDLGGGLKGWRPIRVEGATRQKNGAYTGGKIVAPVNADISGFSIEQYYGNVPHPSGEWSLGEFQFRNMTLGYYDYVRRRLAAPDFAYNPVDELRHGMQTNCQHIKERKVAVDRARDAGLDRRPHPKKLPPNIYGTNGEWEEFSTPSRDARLKINFIELRREIQTLVEKLHAGDASVRYDGADLPGDLLTAYREEANACQIIYRRSDDTRVRLDYDQIAQRLFELSFDPFNCVERRWGASGTELESCTDGKTKTAWYAAERFLRYQAERTYDVRMDFTLDALKPPMLAPPEKGGLGVDAPADVDLKGYLEDLAHRRAKPEIEAGAAPRTGAAG